MSDVNPTIKQKGFDKISRIPVKLETGPILKKPDWIKIKLKHSDKVAELKSLIKEHKLHTVCEEASCPNLPECFSKGTATFMIMGDKCTRRCTFCDVGHGRPDPLDKNEPLSLAKAIQTLKLSYVVITSVDRDDLKDGGALHFTHCISETKRLNPNTFVEVLVPDFRGRLEKAVNILKETPPDVFNHNIETVPRLYKPVRPGSSYQHSLDLLKSFKAEVPHVPTKSGIMLGLGETKEEVMAVIKDLRDHNVEMLTVGQYLQPSPHHHPVLRYVTPEEFLEYEVYAKSIGFSKVASGPFVRSSYHAEEQLFGHA